MNRAHFPNLLGKYSFKNLARYYYTLTTGFYSIGLRCQECRKEITLSVVQGSSKKFSFICSGGYPKSEYLYSTDVVSFKGSK